ncbi:hypothetical protein [Clostridium autoethanogenum]|uniref:Uncharacterized protein n=1 Tax=Clostridium autoethanogenum DSM 10061 TaxID=1341692 RepID=A0ABN4BBT1_9CLOT|nr:hypothetical protein [Clostridium autoethanogenum]AGY74528.1 hypothetical protein CAETHG_0297 [Clostridium autoethanogenum DSM 10061]ALU34715.1 Hypothetical protein CLAU_0286 [Clostridium autoethanogenum DSM 10061]OVY51434.1 hypothetical protein WX72_01567 [Clostridium autoethanogenum]
MNITIEDKALSYAREKEGDFVVRTISAPGGCFSMDVREITVEFIKDFKANEKIFNSYSYKEINVFIEKGLEIKDDEVLIYQKAKLPFIGERFGSKGVSVKYL